MWQRGRGGFFSKRAAGDKTRLRERGAHNLRVTGSLCVSGQVLRRRQARSRHAAQARTLERRGNRGAGLPGRLCCVTKVPGQVYYTPARVQQRQARKRPNGARVDHPPRFPARANRKDGRHARNQPAGRARECRPPQASRQGRHGARVQKSDRFASDWNAAGGTKGTVSFWMWGVRGMNVGYAQSSSLPLPWCHGNFLAARW